MTKPSSWSIYMPVVAEWSNSAKEVYRVLAYPSYIDGSGSALLLIMKSGNPMPGVYPTMSDVRRAIAEWELDEEVPYFEIDEACWIPGSAPDFWDEHRTGPSIN